MNQSPISLSEEEVQNIQRIISTFNESNLNYLDLQIGELKIKISKSNASEFANEAEITSIKNPIAPPANQIIKSEAPINHDSLDSDEIQIKSPMVGRYYSQPEPGANKYVELGSEVHTNTTVALIEAMKMFNAVTAGVKGQISKVCVNDGDLVEFGQVLFHVKLK
jgi:acetyl-CoA carboxylase biotin carboxyl carrier protein